MTYLTLMIHPGLLNFKWHFPSNETKHSSAIPYRILDSLLHIVEIFTHEHYFFWQDFTPNFLIDP